MFRSARRMFVMCMHHRNPFQNDYLDAAAKNYLQPSHLAHEHKRVSWHIYKVQIYEKKTPQTKWSLGIFYWHLPIHLKLPQATFKNRPLLPGTTAAVWQTGSTTTNKPLYQSNRLDGIQSVQIKTCFCYSNAVFRVDLVTIHLLHGCKQGKF